MQRLKLPKDVFIKVDENIYPDKRQVEYLWSVVYRTIEPDRYSSDRAIDSFTIDTTSTPKINIVYRDQTSWLGSSDSTLEDAETRTEGFLSKIVQVEENLRKELPQIIDIVRQLPKGYNSEKPIPDQPKKKTFASFFKGK
jgi:hypothetical protein